MNIENKLNNDKPNCKVNYNNSNNEEKRDNNEISNDVKKIYNEEKNYDKDIDKRHNWSKKIWLKEFQSNYIIRKGR